MAWAGSWILMGLALDQAGLDEVSGKQPHFWAWLSLWFSASSPLRALVHGHRWVGMGLVVGWAGHLAELPIMGRVHMQAIVGTALD
jgi:hypothetical protein